jgi:hypothetical protein
MIVSNDEKCCKNKCKDRGIVSLWDNQALARKSYCLYHYGQHRATVEKRRYEKELTQWLASL